MNVPLLDLVGQYHAIKDDVIGALLKVAERQHFILGEEVAQLEAALAKLTDSAHAIGCASGTDALLLPLRTLDLKPGDEVIVPAFTFFATAGTVHNTGGKPVFVDIDPETLNLTPAAVEAAITPRTRAIIVVHLFGQMTPMEPILAIAEQHGVAVIEDAAQAIGARQQIGAHWRQAGSLGYAGTFSFFPTKNLGGWGDGGLMVTQDAALAQRLRRLRTHGGAKQYHHDEVGYNSRLDTIQAAILLAKLPYLFNWTAARQRVARRYNEAFAGHPKIRPPVVAPGNEHIFHQYTIQVERRDQLVAHLKANGIGSAVYYPLGLHLQPCFSYLGYRPGSLPVTEAATGAVVSLPVFPELTTEQQDTVIRVVKQFYQ